MNKYEIPFAVLTEIPTQGIESLKSRFLDTLEKHDGRIVSCEYWGVKNLAYKIKKQSKARYFVLKIEAKESFPANITKYLRINEIILRYAIYKEEDSFNENPSPILAKIMKSPEYLSTEDEKSYAAIFETKSN
jgi:small subunit ribosomal protein S6